MYKKKNVLSRKRVILVFLIVITVFGVDFVYRRLHPPKDYYQLASRVDNVKTLDLSEQPDFQSVGWLQVQGTSLDMPVLYNVTGDYVYSDDFNNFTWISGEDAKFHNFLTIKGHNIFNLSAHPELDSELFKRFEKLMSFVYYDFAKENKYIQLTLGEKEYIYKIFAVEFVPETASTSFPYYQDLSESEMKTYVKYMKDHSFYHYDIDVNEKDDVLSLVTCTRFFGLSDRVDFYVTARLLRDDEPIDNYDVWKTNNYRIIEKTLKGDENNEENV